MDKNESEWLRVYRVHKYVFLPVREYGTGKWLWFDYVKKEAYYNIQTGGYQTRYTRVWG